MTTTQWRQYESERWREAVRNRGLRMRSLDADERELVLEAITADLERRKRNVLADRGWHQV